MRYFIVGFISTVLAGILFAPATLSMTIGAYSTFFVYDRSIYQFSMWSAIRDMLFLLSLCLFLGFISGKIGLKTGSIVDTILCAALAQIFGHWSGQFSNTLLDGFQNSINGPVDYGGISAFINSWGTTIGLSTWFYTSFAFCRLYQRIRKS